MNYPVHSLAVLPNVVLAAAGTFTRAGTAEANYVEALGRHRVDRSGPLASTGQPTPLRPPPMAT